MDNNKIFYAGKEFDFGDSGTLAIAQNMLDMMRGANKPQEYIVSMLQGFGKVADKSEKYVALQEFNDVTAALRKNVSIATLIASALDQFEQKGKALGVKFTSKLGNKLFTDIDGRDTSTVNRIVDAALDLKGVDVFVSYHDNDDPAEGESDRYVRVAIEAKEALALIEKANNDASNIAKDALQAATVESGFKVITGEDWYPVVRPLSASGGSKGGAEKTRFVKLTWKGVQYDGTKKEVYERLHAAGLPDEMKVGDKTAKLSKNYTSKYLDMLNELGGVFADYQKYNKSAE